MLDGTTPPDRGRETEGERLPREAMTWREESEKENDRKPAAKTTVKRKPLVSVARSNKRIDIGRSEDSSDMEDYGVQTFKPCEQRPRASTKGVKYVYDSSDSNSNADEK